MSISSSLGWRSVIVEHLLPNDTGHVGPTGEVSVFTVLAPEVPDPTPAQLDEIAATFARYGGFARARVVGRFWFGYPVLTPEQQRAAAGIE